MGMDKRLRRAATVWVVSGWLLISGMVVAANLQPDPPPPSASRFTMTVED